MQFPRLHAYEQALVALTGRPLQEALPLTEEQRLALLQRDDPTALYVLHRLSPHDARRIVLEQFRIQGPRLGRFHAAIMIHGHDLLAIGLPEEQAIELLGPPDHGKDPYRAWDTDGLVAPVSLVLRFEDGALAETRLVEGERCP